MTLVAVVDGNEISRARISRHLRSSELNVTESSDALQALRLAFVERPDAAIVDLDLPGIDGYEFVRVFRAACEIPVIAAVNGASPTAIVRALDAGADDAVDKNGSVAELAARVRAALRRYQKRDVASGDAKRVMTGSLLIDRIGRVVSKRGHRVRLTGTEYRLLEALSSKIGQVADRRFLLSTVWGDAYADDSHYLRVYVTHLRAKLEDDPSRPKYILNEWGTGYRLALLPIEDMSGDEALDADRELLASTLGR